MNDKLIRPAAWTTGLAAGCLLLAGGAQAQDGPSYNYAQIGYLNVDVDDADVDGDGFSLGGSFALTDMFHLVGSYDDGELDGAGADFDLTRLRLGGGVNYAITPSTDLVGTLYYVDYELDGPGADVDEDGFGLTAGVRSMLSEQLELNGLVRYEDLGGDADDETSLGVGGVYSFTSQLAGYAGAEFGDDVTEYGLGVRWYFGAR